MHEKAKTTDTKTTRRRQMKPSTNVTSDRQLIFVLFLLVTAYSTIDLPKTMAQASGRLGWLVIAITAVIFATTISMFASLQKMNSGKVFADYTKDMLGPVMSKLLCVFYFLVIFVTAIYLNVKLVNLLTNNFLTETPALVLRLIGLLLFAYIAYKGVTNVARMIEIIGVLFLLITLGILVFMITQGMPEAVLPLLDSSELGNVVPGIWALLAPFAGMEVFTVMPFHAINKNAPKKLFVTKLLIGALYILIVQGTIMTLGINNTIHFSDPFIEAIKIVRIPIIERTDIFYLTVGLTSLFSAMIMMFCALFELASKIFCCANKQKVAFPIIFVFFVACTVAIGIPYFNKAYTQMASYLILFSSLLIPTALFFIKKIQLLQKKKAKKGARA